jgi:mRNA interferase MazF
VKRGEIWLARLNPQESGEAAKAFVCLIVSPAEIHDHLDVAIVAPMAAGSSPAAFRIAATVEGKAGRFLLEQVRTLDKAQLVRCVGAVDRKTLSAALRTLRDMFAE